MKQDHLHPFRLQSLWRALQESLWKLSPRAQIRNPVMFVTYLGAILVTLYVFQAKLSGSELRFNVQIAFWLWGTLLFANLAEALAESRGKAHAQSLKGTHTGAKARLIEEGVEREVGAVELKVGDLILCKAGEVILADGEVVEGIATVDESAITGESAPVIRESGGDRSAVTTGTTVLSDQIVIRVTSEHGKTFLDRMIAMIESSERQKTPNEVALTLVLLGLTLIFLIVVATLVPFVLYSETFGARGSMLTVPILVALLVCLIPTTIGGLLSAIGIAGMDRLVRYNVIAKSGRAVEAAGDIDLLILDKTGTITFGNRMATRFLPAPGYTEQELAAAAQLASLTDETPEGRSIVVLAKSLFNLRGENFTSRMQFHPFSAQKRMSGVDLLDEKGNVLREIRKGAVDAIQAYVKSAGFVFPQELEVEIAQIAWEGGTPLLVCENSKIIGVIHLRDVVKGGIRERFSQLRKMGIRTLMVTGDNPLTAAAIAAEAGVDDFIAEATPEMKYLRIRQEQEAGKLVAMTGDGTNDAPALALADVAVVMNTGTQASREAGNMIDLDSNPTKLIEIVQIGKQLLMTRGALTTFSLANDVAKYFAVLPAIFSGLYVSGAQPSGPLAAWNIMQLHSPQSAILSALIFNALILLLLIPLAMRGIPYRSQSAVHLLWTHLLIYGVGGVIAPFLGIKLIDSLIVALGWVK